MSLRGIGLIRLRVGIVGKFFWMRHWTSGFHVVSSHLFDCKRVLLAWRCPPPSYLTFWMVMTHSWARLKTVALVWDGIQFSLQLISAICNAFTTPRSIDVITVNSYKTLNSWRSCKHVECDLCCVVFESVNVCCWVWSLFYTDHVEFFGKSEKTN